MFEMFPIAVLLKQHIWITGREPVGVLQHRLRTLGFYFLAFPPSGHWRREPYTKPRYFLDSLNSKALPPDCTTAVPLTLSFTAMLIPSWAPHEQQHNSAQKIANKINQNFHVNLGVKISEIQSASQKMVLHKYFL